MYRSSGSSPSPSTMALHSLEDYGARKVKPLPKRRRMMEPSFSSTTSTTTTTTGPDRSWSITANFPNVDKVMNMNTTITREQFMAHAGELAKRLTHQLQGRLPPGDRMELVQALLQQQQAQSGSGSAGGPMQSPGEHGATATYSVSLPVPALSPDAKFDLDAVFAAGFEAGIAGAVGGFDSFDEADSLPSTWDEVAAEFLFTQRTPPPPPNQSLGPVGEVTTDLGRRGMRDGDEEEEEEGDGDYDHLRQPGNTKKRKVPANIGASPGSRRGGGEGLDDDDPGGLGGLLAGQRGNATDGNISGGQSGDKELSYGASGYAVGPPGLSYPRGPGNRDKRPLGRLPLLALSNLASTQTSTKRVGQLNAIVKARGKLAGVMVAGIRHKEMLKARKRQLAAVMGVLSGTSPPPSSASSGLPPNSSLASVAALCEASTLALDQALSMVGSLPQSFQPPASAPMGAAISKAAASIRGNGQSNTGPGRDKRKAEGDGKENEAGVPIGAEQMPAVRLSRRVGPRLARAATVMMVGGTNRLIAPLPQSKFTFSVNSETKDRVIATKQEVATLRNRFEAELERQAANAERLAAASKALVAASNGTAHGSVANTAHNLGGAGGTPKGTRPKKSKVGSSPSKTRKDPPSTNVAHGAGAPSATGKPGAAVQQPHQGAPAAQRQPQPQAPRQGAPANANGGSQQPQSQLSPHIIPSSKPKKKKRSAMANASNPHHLRNYVPSRLPHSTEGGGGHGGNAGLNAGYGLLGPLPVRFLTAELPPRRGNAGVNSPSSANGAGKKKGSVNGGAGSGGGTGTSGGAAVGPATDEWMCAFCEYDLFFGDDAAFRKAVSSRKKILKRRRRARERAAAAANGVKNYGKGGQGSAGPVVGESEGEEEEDFDLEEDYDGDVGYEAGGNGRDEFGNVPKHQTKSTTGGTVGVGQQGLQGTHVVDPAG
ncbi:hypothetical protein D9611_008182 [Ephemerocybe angulata]|uniref:Uncharacterized protein n=1 Tax=Ephemerocybe angulata TaxID=980116 RepID=A0A8H5C181_9AGAR|nr:hypothetical protein D9611_008182 [Tulosesus angulatus]